MPKIQSDIKSLARSHTRTAIRTLAAIMTSPEVPPGVRVTAATALLDRGWGRPMQPLATEGGPLIVEVVRFGALGGALGGAGGELRVIEPEGGPPQLAGPQLDADNSPAL